MPYMCLVLSLYERIHITDFLIFISSTIKKNNLLQFPEVFVSYNIENIKIVQNCGKYLQ